MTFQHVFTIFIIFVLITGTLSSIPETAAQTITRDGVTDTDSSEFQTVKQKHAKLSETAQKNGWVRIIVELDTTFELEWKFATMQEKINQRANIHAVQNSLKHAISQDGVLSSYDYKFFPYSAMTVNSNSLKQLMSSPLVKTVHEDRMYKPTLDASVPLIGVNSVFTTGLDGSGQVVAIMDTGVDKTHSFFSDGSGGNRIVSEACYTEYFPPPSFGCPNGFSEQTGTGAAVPCLISGCDHGTHVSGIAAGNDITNPNFSGVAKGADIVAIQIFTTLVTDFYCAPTPAPCIGAFDSDIMKGLERVLALKELGFNIASVNMSIGGGGSTTPCDSVPLKPIIDNLRLAGVATVVASGNNGFINAISYPACISSAISVGSTTVDSHGSGLPNDSVSFFSNEATFLDLVAPGEWILSSVPDNVFNFKRGTSMAAPHVAGAFALLKESNPTASVDDILTALKDTGIPVLEPYGGITKPRIQLDAALALLDITPPIVIPPPSQSVESVSPSGAVVNYPPPTATDNVGVTVGPSCIPVSGSTFPIGDTTVNCTAEDAAGNVGAASFTVSVSPFVIPPESDIIIPFGTEFPGCEITNDCFIPFTFETEVGMEVVWFNDGNAGHAIASGNSVDGTDGIFSSGLMLSGDTFSHTFLNSGVFPYFDLVHPWAQGEVVVLEPEPLFVGTFCGRDAAEFNQILGTLSDDTLIGTSLDDLIDGLGGNDSIQGLGGNDCLIGGDGVDRLSGGPGNDYLQGGNGADSMKGGSGDDFMTGDAGNDRMSGGPDNDEIYGGDGDDQLTGRDGDDLLFGDGDNDILSGGTGNDTMDGGSGDDHLLGRSGDNSISGGPGNDVCVGDSGTNTIDSTCEITDT